MSVSAAAILDTLDRSAEAFVFPMLDNGYVYPAAARMALFRSPADWAIVFETFGFSPRTGVPDLVVTTMGSAVRHHRPAGYDDDQFETHLRLNPNWTSHFFHPVEQMPAVDVGDEESIAVGADGFRLRGDWYPMPDDGRYEAGGIDREDAGKVYVYEWARVLAIDHRAAVLATEQERRAGLPPGMTMLLALDDWPHPHLADGQRPSDEPAFEEIARVLERGDAAGYRPAAGNTHWSNWPDGGSL